MSGSEAIENEAKQTAHSEPVSSTQELPEAAKRALAEAEARRAERSAADKAGPKEVGGPQGLDPARYGDWERDGIVSDF